MKIRWLSPASPRAKASSPRLLSWLASLAVIIVLAGCGTLRSQDSGGNWDIREAGGETITLQVDNDNFFDARIYARWNGERQRLGIVTGNTSETFTLQGRPSSLRIEVDFIAAGGFTSERIDVGPGAFLIFRVPARRF